MDQHHHHQPQQQHQGRDRRRAGRHRLARVVAPAATALLLLTLGAAPSSARPDPGDPIARVDRPGGCVLQRVATQYVRCDVLTGNGVPAPAWIPER